MNHSDILNNVPNVDSIEFKKFLKDNGFYVKTTNYADDINSNFNKDDKTKETIKADSKSIKNYICNMINQWCTKNPYQALAIITVGSTIFMYKLMVSIIANAVFKGNLKTNEYFTKNYKYHAS